MPVERSWPLSLLTQREAELLVATTPRALREHSPAKVNQLITRTRRLKSRYTGLAAHQVGVARGKRAPRGARSEGATNAKRKARLFSDALERLEARRESLRKAARPRPRPSRSRAQPKPPRKPVARAKVPRAASVRRGARGEQSFHAKKRRAHASARGRRHQAKKDRR